MSRLVLEVVERGIGVGCPDPSAWTLLSATYGAMRAERRDVALEYRVTRTGATGAYRIERDGTQPLVAHDDASLLAHFDAEMSVALQRLRPDLYFIHAAVLERQGSAVLLVARSGGGKSTLAWALLHHGFTYLSDELAPVELSTSRVLPYPRALMVKRDPPPSYPMEGGLRTSRGVHVPASAMPAGVRTKPAPLGDVVFLDHRPQAPAPTVRRLGVAAAAARLYVNALNPLAHQGDGLDGAIAIAGARPCFELVTTELRATCALLMSVLARTP